MKKEEGLFLELLKEVAVSGVHTDRFTELWIATGVRLESMEFDLANRLLIRFENEIGQKTIH